MNSATEIIPGKFAELRDLLKKAEISKTKLERVNLEDWNHVIEYSPEDMTVTVQAGMCLEALQQELKKSRQWLPIDPPHSGSTSIATILDRNLSGPRRFGYGTIREHLIGLKVMLADGRVVFSGGKVVKNVAGYDLAKLFIGAYGSLGIVLEATFKLLPLPQQESLFEIRAENLSRAGEILEKIDAMPVNPVILDLYGSYETEQQPGACRLVLGFAGPREEVEWQTNLVKDLGLEPRGDLGCAQAFWDSIEFQDQKEQSMGLAGARPSQVTIRKISTLPSRLIEKLGTIRTRHFVARAGNGVIYCATSSPVLPERPLGASDLNVNAGSSKLEQRLKDIFDPKHIFRDLPQNGFSH